VIAVSGSLAEIVSAEPARFSATVPAGTDLPALSGAVRHDGELLTVRTDRLQDDLTAFLAWAGDRGLRLPDLRAAPASLADIYHAIRMEER
jgi:ABC-2 type transport system ATP-binding protein